VYPVREISRDLRRRPPGSGGLELLDPEVRTDRVELRELERDRAEGRDRVPRDRPVRPVQGRDPGEVLGPKGDRGDLACERAVRRVRTDPSEEPRYRWAVSAVAADLAERSPALGLRRPEGFRPRGGLAEPGAARRVPCRPTLAQFPER